MDINYQAHVCYQYFTKQKDYKMPIKQLAKELFEKEIFEANQLYSPKLDRSFRLILGHQELFHFQKKVLDWVNNLEIKSLDYFINNKNLFKNLDSCDVFTGLFVDISAQEFVQQNSELTYQNLAKQGDKFWHLPISKKRYFVDIDIDEWHP